MLATPAHALSGYVDALLSTPEMLPAANQNIGAPADLNPTNWKNSRFSVLMLDIAGMRFALPEHRVSEHLDSTRVPLDDDHGWLHFMHHQGKLIPAIELFGLVIPPEQQARLWQPSLVSGYLLLDDASWAVVLRSPAQQWDIEPGQVTWSSAQSARPWLAGIIGGQRAALLDVDAVKASISLLQRASGSTT